ncbi:MAG: hypothetical protein J6W67_03555 [Lentisphaeria bacterium]|nr:hypothetical protein [Lentisphaeria bacterium]
MDSLDNELTTQAETRQMQKLQMYQKLVIFTALKYKWSIIAVFVLTLIAGVCFRYIQFSNSQHKFEGSITLFYTPRASEEVKPLSINHVLGVFSRQQIFHQLVEEMHLTEKQKSVLKQCIEVKLLRDHNDMFVITGIGESEEYVKQLVNTFVNLGIRNYEEYRTAELRNFLNSREQRMAEIQAYQKNQIEKIHGLHRKYGIIHPKEEMENVKKIQGEQNATLAELNVKLADARHRFSVAEKDYKVIPPAVIKHRGKLREFINDMRKMSREYEKAKLMFAERNPRFVEAKTAYEVTSKEFEAFKAKNNIKEFEENMLLGIEGIISRYQETEVTLNQLELSMKSLKAEMALIKEKERKLQHMIPEHESIERLLETVNKNISLLVEELTRVRSNISHVPNDIIVNERVTGVKAFPMFPVKIFALIFIAGIFVGGIYATFIITYDLVNGKFSGIEEAAFHKDFFDTVGVIPDENAPFTAEQRQIINNEMFYRFILRLKDVRTLFSCSLDGSFLSSVLFDEQFTKAKRNTILIRLIDVADVEKICGNMQKIGNFYYSDSGKAGVDYRGEDKGGNAHAIEYFRGFSAGDGKGYGYGYGFAFFPVRNLSVLEPDEISMLYDIVNELKKHYQLIRISREKPFDASCILVRQLHDICDATLLYIGKRKTPRSVMRRVLKLHDDEHKVYAILTGVTDVEKVISGDYIR